MKKENISSFKNEIEECFNNKDYDKALINSQKMKTKYPKNYYGYYAFIKSKTNDFNKYLKEDELKELKKDFSLALELDKNNNLDDFKTKFNEYLDDYTEVAGLNKIKKELVSTHLLKQLYNYEIAYINQNIDIINSYNLSGKKIVNGYDFIKGLFLVACLIFNLIFRNYFLILTVPFGIFGLITIYSFFNTNFIGNDVLKSEKDKVKKMIAKANKKINDLKNEVLKKNEAIKFLNEQKNSCILKIPESFYNSIKQDFLLDEKNEAESILDELLSNNISSFTYLVNEKTNLNIDDVLSQIKPVIIEKEDDLTNFINDKVNQKKSNNSKVILMKPIKKHDYVIVIMLLIVSVISIFALVKTFKEIKTLAFILGLITGLLSIFIYNIKTGKHMTFKDALLDNLLSAVFNATLTNDLIYLSFSSKLDFFEGFIKMPFIFTFILIGLVGIITALKYNNLIIKLRGK